MRLGLKTNTYDMQGEPVAPAAPVQPPSDEAIAKALPEFRGDIFQTESRWCSVRREGSAGYEIADTGEHKPFLAHVYKFEVGRTGSPDRLAFKVAGTKGLIVRSLVNDFGDAVGTGACLESLRRTRVGKFRLEDAVPFDRILETDIADFASLAIPVAKAFA